MTITHYKHATRQQNKLHQVTVGIVMNHCHDPNELVTQMPNSYMNLGVAAISQDLLICQLIFKDIAQQPRLSPWLDMAITPHITS